MSEDPRRMLAARRADTGDGHPRFVNRADRTVHTLESLGAPHLSAYYGSDGAWVIDIDTGELMNADPDSHTADGVPCLRILLDEQLIDDQPRRVSPEQPIGEQTLRIPHGPRLRLRAAPDGHHQLVILTDELRARDPAAADADDRVWMRIAVNDGYVHDHSPAQPLHGSRDELGIEP